jgi:hypothetical protein
MNLIDKEGWLVVTPLSVSLITFALIFGGALAGMRVRKGVV